MRIFAMLHSTLLRTVQAALVLCMIAATAVSAATYTVTSAADSGAGSLRQALLDANANCGAAPHTISFDIVGTGPHVINLASALPSLACQMTVDGYTQPQYTSTAPASANSDAGASNNANLLIVLNGSSCAACNGMTLTGTGIVIRGLVIHSFPAAGIRISTGANFATIEGNYIGTDAGGMTDFGNQDGVFIDNANNVTIGGSAAASRNLITGNNDAGIDAAGTTIAGLIVRNNQLGGTRSGGTTFGNTNSGLYSNSSVAAAGNVRVDNNWVTANYDGIYVRRHTIVENNKVHTNTIGITLFFDNNTAKSNEVYNNSNDGIWITDAGCQVESNSVYNNGQYGINVWFGPTTLLSNTVFGNSNGGVNVDTSQPVAIVNTRSYSNNGRSGITIDDTDITVNDYSATAPSPPHDADSPGTVTGPQNYPEITSVVQGGGNTTVNGFLRTDGLSQNYRIELFSNSAASVRDGQVVEDSFIATTDANGELTFARVLTGSKTNISATATRQVATVDTETSQYSPAVAATVSACGNTEVTNTADSGACSLRAAITYANANCGSGPHTITFNITGTGPHRIQPVSPLPTISCDTTVIDGYSQPGSAQNSAAAGQTNANIQIWLDGALAPGGTNGFVFDPSSGWTVRGLSITRFDRAVSSRRPGNLRGNFLGVEPDGVTPGKNNYGVFWDIGGDPQFGGTVGGANPADVNLISANTSGVAMGNAVFVSVRGNLFGHDRNGSPSPSLGWAGNGVSNGTCDSSRHDFVYDNFFAHVQTAGSSSCGHWEFVNNRVILGNFVISSPFAMSFNQRFTRVTYNLSTSSTTLEGTFDAVDAVSNHKLQFFGNPGLPLNNDNEWLRDLLTTQDITPAAAGSQPFTYTHGGLVDDPSIMRVVFGAPRLTYRAFQYRKPLTLSTVPTAFSVAAGASVSYQTLTITNRLPADPLILTGMIPTVSGSGFSIGANTCGASLAPLASCTIQIGYARPTAGSDSGSFDLELPSTVRNSGGTSVTTVFSFALSGTATAAPGPVFSPSSTSFTFAPTAIGLSSAAQILTITNSGGTTMNISGATLVPAGDFTSGTTCGTTLAPLASCTVTFTFSPTATGIRNATKTITTDAPGSPHVISLSGTGVAAGLEPTVTFGPTTVAAGISSTLSVTLNNSNGSAATVNPVTFTYPGGLTNAAVTNVASTCGGTPTASAGGNSVGFATAFVIASGGSCTLSVSVTSTVPASYTVNATAGSITSNIGSNTLNASSTLTVTPALALPTMTVSFLPTNVATSAASVLTLAFNNTNTVAVTLSSFNVAYPPGLVNTATPSPASTCAGAALVATAGTPDLTQTTAGVTLPPSGSCQLTVNVTSAAAGSYSLSVAAGAINSDAGLLGASNIATLVVGLPPPTGTLTPASLAFGSVTVGASSAPQALLLTNTSTTTPLSISAVSAIGPFAFAAGTTCAVGVPLVALGTCVVEVQFNPLLIGAAAGTVSVVTNGGSFGATLSGTGLPLPALNILFAPASLDFGSVAPGTTSAVQMVTMSNTGTAALSVTSMTATPPYNIVLSAALPALAPESGDAKRAKASFACPTGSFSLAAGSDCSFGVTFSPTMPGEQGGVVSVANSGTTLTLALTGTGGIGKAINVNPTSIDFGPVIFLQPAAPRVVTISGTGFESVTLSGVQIVPGLGAATGEVADFSVTHDCAVLPPAPAPGCTATVGFRPSAIGARAADLRISGDFDGGTLLIPLDGTGIPSPVPLLSFSATRFGFGQSPIGSGRSMSMTVSNAGQLPVRISAIRTLGDFHVRHDCPAILSVGSVCTVSPASLPMVPGARFGTLVIESDARDSPATFPLEAFGCRLFSLRDARTGSGFCSP